MSRPNRRLRADATQVPSPQQRLQSALLTLFRLAFVVTVLTGVILLCASVWRSFVQIDALKLTTVELKGAQRTHRATLLAAAGTDFGTPLLSIDLLKAAQGMTLHPWVRSATLRRQLPNRLHIDVQEHSPKALLMRDTLWLVNTLGEPFKPFESQDNLVLPVLTGLPASNDQALTEALLVLDALEHELGEGYEVLQLHVDEDLGLTAYLGVPPPHDRPVVFHLGPDAKARVPLIASTLKLLSAQGVVPAVIWANGERAPDRIQVQPVRRAP